MTDSTGTSILSPQYVSELKSRRALLKGLGLGALLFSPLMRSLAARAAGQGKPKLLIMYTPNGFHMDKMTANKMGAGANPNVPVFANSLSPLNPYASSMLVLKNLDSTLDTDGFARSHEQQAALLTGFSTKMNNGNKHFQNAQGPSIDWTIAKALGQEPLGLGVMFNPNNTYKHLWAGKDTPNDPVNDPRQLVNTLFPLANASSPASASNLTLEKEQARCQLLRDSLLEDSRTLGRRLGTEDRARLEPYIESMESLKCTLEAPPPPLTTCTRPVVDKNIDFGNSAQWRARAMANLEVIIAAFRCGYRDVASLSFANGVAGDNIHDVKIQSHHHWSHTNEHNLNPALTIEKIDTAYAQFYADMLGRFQAAGLLEDVCVLWISELVDGNGHNQDNRQWLLGGGGAGKLKTGNVLTFAGGAKDRCTNKLCTTLANVMGLSLKTFGDPNLTTEGPLTGVLA
ncbi:MAG: DUF1552 domain-containing protein [Silvanigrellales bacterium]|nr:DUF1552 domain-containing protein [Silvanigrellales bacterium]